MSAEKLHIGFKRCRIVVMHALRQHYDTVFRKILNHTFAEFMVLRPYIPPVTPALKQYHIAGRKLRLPIIIFVGGIKAFVPCLL